MTAASPSTLVILIVYNQREPTELKSLAVLKSDCYRIVPQMTIPMIPALSFSLQKVRFILLWKIFYISKASVPCDLETMGLVHRFWDENGPVRTVRMHSFIASCKRESHTMNFALWGYLNA